MRAERWFLLTLVTTILIFSALVMGSFLLCYHGIPVQDVCGECSR
jgi:heme/copper-type cytochrome/quinol oxidase subunit 4